MSLPTRPAAAGDFDEEQPPRPRRVSSRTPIMSAGEAINQSLGRRRRRTREREQ